MRTDVSRPKARLLLLAALLTGSLGGCVTRPSEIRQQEQAEQAVTGYMAAAACHGRQIPDSSPAFEDCMRHETAHRDNGLFASLW